MFLRLVRIVMRDERKAPKNLSIYEPSPSL